jgi:hypothetical protein
MSTKNKKIDPTPIAEWGGGPETFVNFFGDQTVTNMGSTSDAARALDELCSQFSEAHDFVYMNECAKEREFTLNEYFRDVWQPTHQKQGGENQFVWDEAHNAVPMEPQSAVLMEDRKTPIFRTRDRLVVWENPKWRSEPKFYNVRLGHTNGGEKIGIMACYAGFKKGMNDFWKLNTLLTPVGDGAEWLNEFTRLNHDVSSYEDWSEAKEKARTEREEEREGRKQLAKDAAINI